MIRGLPDPALAVLVDQVADHRRDLPFVRGITVVRVFAVLLFSFLPQAAFAADFTMAAKSGRPTLMHVYRSWNENCQAKLGVVKVLAKPAHGKLTPTQVTTTISVSRYRPERTAHCIGKPTAGFRVDYTSAPGFHGIDNFTIQFDYGHRPDIDNYTVKVE